MMKSNVTSIFVNFIATHMTIYRDLIIMTLILCIKHQLQLLVSKILVNGMKFCFTAKLFYLEVISSFGTKFI